MNISDQGLKLLMLREGSRHNAYKDTKGIWTIGVGHTGPEVLPNLVWSDVQVMDALRKDIAITEKCLDDNVTVLLGQEQVDALCSFIFNVGIGAFRRSTMLKYINKGMMKEAAAEFDRWHIPPEITSRRNSEKSQFQGT
jgi:lysozyme